MISSFAFIIALIISHINGYILSGYICPTCPSAKDPESLIANINTCYNRVNIAFLGFDSNGNIIDQFDAPKKNFTLTKEMVKSMQNKGIKVYISVGGGAGATMNCDSLSTQFEVNFINGVLNYTNALGFDGVDFDIEHRNGDYVVCDQFVANVMGAFYRQGLGISMAPQMPNLYPDGNSVSGGFNELAPLVSMVNSTILSIVAPQMYNSWAQVETTTYAEQYVSELNAGYTVTGDGQTFNVQVSPNNLLLGYPASPSGAGSGYINPSQLQSMYKDLISKNLQINGFMTWSIGWDQQNNYNFANTLCNL